MVDLHAVPGSQNGQEHSATIDGVAEWASGSDADGRSYIDLSLNAIDFLASRSAGFLLHTLLCIFGILNLPAYMHPYAYAVQII